MIVKVVFASILVFALVHSQTTPDNDTTVKPTDNSTTEAPTENPTDKPTTEAPTQKPATHNTTASTSTEAPTTNGTTEAPPTNGTTKPTSPTTTPKPTPVPSNKVTLKLTTNKKTCAMIVGKLTMIIPYNTTENKTVQASLNFPENSTVTGNCSMSPLVMTVEYRKGFELAIKFGSDKDNIWWSEAITTVDYSDTFVFPNISEKHNNATSTTTFNKQFQASKKGSYLCNADTTTALGNLQLKTVDFQYTALQDDVTKFSSDNVSECSADSKTNSIVPIAVGAALAGLVVIVLIAYLIGRRRNRKGYESV